MSFILDALKKSEAERQRQNVPGLLNLGPAAPRPRFPVWGIWLGLLLGVNLLVLMGVLIRGWIPGGAAPSTESKPSAHAVTTATKAPDAAPAIPAASPIATPLASAASPPNPSADAGSFSPMDAPVYAPEILVAGVPVTESSVSPQYSSSAGSSPAVAPLQRPDPRLARALYPPAPPDEVLPTLNEINLSGNHGIPELHMDIHVFAARPSERFVFFNNRKYREGETLQEGPSVERITRDGVVLRFQGFRFTVPRQ